MRNTFARIITDLAIQDDRVVLLSGDIGNRLFDEFKSRFPDRFINCGVAEQNMMGVASGMAMKGWRPFVYTITPFLVYRPFEQIRTDLCYNNVPVVIAGVGSGLAYAELGSSHHSCEDIAVLRSLPNMTIVCPGDSRELEAAMPAMLNVTSPAYLRLGKKGEPQVHADVPQHFEVGRALVYSRGADICLMSTGNMLPAAVDAANQLEQSHLSVEVTSMHTVKPLDTDYLTHAFSRFQLIAILEEHSMIGGLSSAVAEFAIDSAVHIPRILRLGTPDSFISLCFHQDQARKITGLSVDEIVSRIKAALLEPPLPVGAEQ